MIKSDPALGEKVVRAQDKMSQLGRAHGQKVVDVKDAVTKYTGLTLESGQTAYQMAKGPAQKISVAVVKVKEAVFNVVQVLLRMWRERSRNIENVNFIENDDKTEAKTAAPEVVPEPKVPDFKAQEP